MKREAFSVKDAAMLLRMTPEQMLDLVRQRKIEASKFFGIWVISRDELIYACRPAGISTKWTELI